MYRLDGPRTIWDELLDALKSGEDKQLLQVVHALDLGRDRKVWVQHLSDLMDVRDAAYQREQTAKDQR